MVKLRRDTISENDYQPIDAGWDARLQAKAISENPYAITNWKHYEWGKGWKLADETADEAPIMEGKDKFN